MDTLFQVTVLPPGEWDPQIRLEPPPQVPSQTERMVSVNKDKEEDGAPPRIPLTCLKIPLQGLILDAKRRYRHYLTDFRDAFWDTTTNKCSVLSLLTTIASIVFIYFANIAPAITFGLVLSDKTGGFLVRLYITCYRVVYNNIIIAIIEINLMTRCTCNRASNYKLTVSDTD